MKQLLTCLFIAAVVIGVIGWAEAQPANGPSITLEQAKKAMAGAEAEAKKDNWPVVIAILDSGGNIVLLQRLDNTH